MNINDMIIHHLYKIYYFLLLDNRFINQFTTEMIINFKLNQKNGILILMIKNK